LENTKFNTAISALMILVNGMEKEESVPIEDYQLLLILLAPLAPHIAEELWERLGHKNSVFLEKWPKPDEKFLKEETVTLIIQVNGRVRDTVDVPADISESAAKALVLSREKVQKSLAGKEIKKTIFVPGKLINFVIR